MLWLNRSTRELDALEFGYRNLNLPVSTSDLGGRIEFDQLPSGRWVTRRWWIRMPRMEARRKEWLLPSDYPVSLVGFIEFGGEVIEVTSPPKPAPRPP